MRRETRRQLDNIYRDRELMEPDIQTLLHESPEAHAEDPVSTTRNWIATHQTLFRNSIRRVKNRALLGMRSISSYFQSRNGG